MLAQREAHGDTGGKDTAEALAFLANHCKESGQLEMVNIVYMYSVIYKDR